MNSKTTTQPRAMKRLYALVEKRPIDLSLSENPFGCSPLVSSAMKKIRIDFNAYPSANGTQLRKKLSENFFLSKDNFFIANGSESIINDLPKIFCKKGDEVLIPTLTFPLFTVCCELADAKVIHVEMTEDLAIDLSKILNNVSKKCKMIFICNPNNPTGSILAKQSVVDFLKKVPKNVLVLIDEANIEFAGESMIEEIVNFSNLIVLRTFSKAFGLASLRVGFAVANEKIIQKLVEETPPFQVTGISEQLACIALKDRLFLEKSKQFVKKERQFLKRELTSLGFKIFPSQANNLFVKIPDAVLPKVFPKSLKKKGVSLVLGSNFEGFDDSFFRIGVRDRKINKLFIKKMKEIIEETAVEATIRQ